MKKLLLFLAFVIMAKSGFTQNGLEGIIVEKYYISNAADAAGSVGVLPSGSTTYRIYVDMLPGYTFQAAYGVAGHELRFQTTTSFFNNEDFGSTVPTYSKNNSLFNTVMLDSWLPGGAAHALNHGILKSEDNVAAGGATVINANGILANADPNAGIPLTTQDGLYTGTPASVTVLGFTPAQLSVFDNVSNAGNLISTTNASWAVLGGASGPTAANKVLIAQFTTNGTFSFKLNVQLGTPTPGVSQNFVAENPVGSEILFPGLIYPAPSNPTALVSIASNTAFPTCAGTSVTFTATPTNGGATPTYQWKKNNANVGTNSPTYTLTGLKNNDQIKCIMTSSIAGALNNPATSNTITSLINPVPDVSITAAGPTTFCNQANLCTLTAQNASGLTLQWTKNNNNISGATGATYVPTTSGTYKVKATTINGCTDLSSGQAIVVNALPIATKTVTGPTTFCSGTNACTITANAGAGLTYQWTKGAALTPISGATGISFQPTTSNNYYKVIVTNGNGCTKASPATAITVNTTPPATITAQGPLTFCAGDSVTLVANSGAGLTYQWLRGVNNIAGATTGSYKAKIAGTYKVQVTSSAGCSKLSTGKKVVINCREGVESEENYTLSVYPNPSTGAFTLNYLSEDIIDANATIAIVDMMGRVVYSEAVEVIEGQIFKQVNMESQFAGGVYFVRLQVGENSLVSKLIIE
ncbi:MAG: T9SS type A sorting domain-containing protein [Bacteroidetes bacterium]|nr:T9SS type A sorting domain-containing protein [Bacteroidota bacterium]